MHWKGKFIGLEEISKYYAALLGFPGSSVIKNLPANAEGLGLIPGARRSPGEGSGCSFQYSCLENSMDRGASWVTVHGVAKELGMTERTHMRAALCA